MQSLSFALDAASVEDSLDAAQLEAKVRSFPGVFSACYRPQQQRLVVLLSDKAPKLRIKTAIWRLLMQGYVSSAKDLLNGANDSLQDLSAVNVAHAANERVRHPSRVRAGIAQASKVAKQAGAVGVTEQAVAQARAAVQKKEEHEDIGAELEHHKRSAIISLVGLGAFELLRRFNPTLYASTTMLRSAMVPKC